MSDLDTLIVTFQTQLSDVMETVVKTAMYEVTRLVEDGFLEEVKRRNQEVESLRIQLQWAERKLSDQEGKEGGKTGKCVDCAKDDVEMSSDAAEQRAKEQQNGETKQIQYLFSYKTLPFLLLQYSFFFRHCEGLWCEERRQLSGKVARNPTGSHIRGSTGSR